MHQPIDPYEIPHKRFGNTCGGVFDFEGATQVHTVGGWPVPASWCIWFKAGYFGLEWRVTWHHLGPKV
jgi:hypothetical protein